jgi:hypothetical protein
MNSADFTAHAAQRLQQRAIPPFVVKLLEQCGSELRCIHSDKLFFDKAARKRLRKHLGGERGMRLFQRYLNIYAVIGDDGRIITVAYQSSRHRSL